MCCLHFTHLVLHKLSHKSTLPFCRLLQGLPTAIRINTFCTKQTIKSYFFNEQVNYFEWGFGGGGRTWEILTFLINTLFFEAPDCFLLCCVKHCVLCYTPLDYPIRTLPLYCFSPSVCLLSFYRGTMWIYCLMLSEAE